MNKLLTLLLLISVSSCNYSDGDRTGQVVKLSRKGYIFKTYEGELATLAKGQKVTMISNSFNFTVKDENVVRKIEDAMNNGKSVTLHYEQAFFIFPWEGASTYFITNCNQLGE